MSVFILNFSSLVVIHYLEEKKKLKQINAHILFWSDFILVKTLFQQHKRRLYTWASTDGQYQNQIDYNLYSQRWRSSIQSAKTRPGTDCGSDHELLIDKLRLKLKKVGKTTRSFKYGLNQIPMITQWKWQIDSRD